MEPSTEKVVEELCQELYGGDWHRFLVDLEERLATKYLPRDKIKNVIRDIEYIKKRIGNEAG
jgi:hypothetical protein